MGSISLPAEEPTIQNANAPYHFRNSYLGERRPVRIILIGAGISGIAAVHIFKEKFKDTPTELIIYEKNEDVGGTWLENRYPGCACDVPAHAYTFSWEGNPSWSKAYVEAPELFQFFKSCAVKYGVDEFVRLKHLVTQAVWCDDIGKWRVNVQNMDSGEPITDEADVLINAAGFLNNWKWPNIPGLDNFKGKKMHSARWDDDYDLTDRTVAVIGSGSSAIQIVPQIRPKVKHLTSFNRSPTWITPEFASRFAKDGRSSAFSEEQKALWTNEPDQFLEYRKEIETEMNGFFDHCVISSKEQQELFAKYTELMKQRLGNNEALAASLVPTFAVGCRRVTPGHGYLESLIAKNVTVRADPILEVQENGIEMKDGSFLPFDVIICATGFDTSFRPPFRLVGKDGRDLRDEWVEEPRSYLSVAAHGYPNYFMVSGPNFPLANGGLIPCLEATLNYAFQVAEKISREGVKSMMPRLEAVNDFQEHKDSVMEELVWSAPCSSWYKNGKTQGKVWGPWCGSSLHFLELMEQARWEDWDIQYSNRNRFHFLGNGRTFREIHGGDLAYYVRDGGQA